MTAAAPKPAEPSMEEILASIRRIIADEDGAATQPASAPDHPHAAPVRVEDTPPPEAAGTPAPEPAPAIDDAPAAGSPGDDAEVEAVESIDSQVADVLHAVAGTGRPLPPRIEAAAAELPRAATLHRVPVEPARPAPPRTGEIPPRAVMAAPPPAQPQARAEPLLAPEVDEAVSRAFNSLAHTVLAENSRTLEDLVREMLRPLLKTWLDDNLPVLVERLVRAEIERVARGGQR